MKKKIGILGWKTGENSFGATVPYLEFIQQYGYPVILNPESPVDLSLDLLIIPGGPDVDPLRYNEIPSYSTGKVDPIREYYDKFIIPHYIDNDIPIFGICRGFQTLSVAFGATLDQNMYHETSEKHRGELVHELLLDQVAFIALVEDNLSIDNNSIIREFKKLKVNSLHHQAVVRNKEFNDQVTVLGTYKGVYEGQYPEVILHNTKPIAAVQYHPEELGYDLISDILILNIIK